MRETRKPLRLSRGSRRSSSYVTISHGTAESEMTGRTSLSAAGKSRVLSRAAWLRSTGIVMRSRLLNGPQQG